MMEGDYSNRTLAYLLLVVLFVSVVGTFITLSKISGFGIPSISISGSATSTTGTTQLQVAPTLMISLITTLVDFGTCSPNSSLPVNVATVFDSNDTRLGGASEGQCTGLTPNPKNITIENQGNVEANVTVNTNNNILAIGNNMSLFFAFVNGSDALGCYKTTAGFPGATWINFTVNNTDYNTCQNLTYSGGFDREWVYFRLYAPRDSVPGARSATLTFTARTVQV